ncbi:ABC transporter substrate-binding protein [Brevibacillus daliensis]|uniref:ABC transporter substrate-binding protein n=1 Tax=Brevibacillus daliensis TaxID=2892995 RepID=UPI001E46B009|nr:ABC transporter substrate-binding protein [Brevibacillus daliensis]
MRKGLGLLLALGMTFSLAACGAQQSAPSTSATPAPATTEPTKQPETKVFKIGISQFVQHPSLDAVQKGIVDGLADNGFKDGEQIEIDLKNANAEMNNTITIAQNFAGDKKDLVVAIATPSAQAAAKSITDVPLVFSTVTDPVAAGLVTSMEKPDKNITGTSDKMSMETQLELIKKFMPELKKVGVIYTTSEINAQVQVEDLKKAAQSMGITIEEAGISAQTEVQLGAQSLLAKKVDVIFIPIDNTVVSAIEGVLSVAEKVKVPVFASDTGSVQKGAVATYGIDYYKMGKQTGDMIARILKGQKVADTPVEIGKDTELTINEKAVQTFGLTISEELRKEAKEILK